jgi:hypothetical protein
VIELLPKKKKFGNPRGRAAKDERKEHLGRFESETITG